jgi:hypothetical protein
MKVKITKAFSKSCKAEIEVEDSDDKKALMKALVFAQPDVCGLCGKPAYWRANKATTDDGEFIYIKRVCSACKAQSVMGDYKGGGHFFKKWEKWDNENNFNPSPVQNKKPTTQKPKSPQQVKQEQPPLEAYDDIPQDLPWEEA